MNLLEGGNARLPSGEQAQKVDLVNLSEKQYEAFKTNIVNVIIEMSNAFNKEYGHHLFSSEAIKEKYLQEVLVYSLINQKMNIPTLSLLLVILMFKSIKPI